MSFKKFDQQTFIVDSANAYTNRQISKREFLRRMGLAGVGFSAFGLGMLGNPRGLRRGSSLIGTEAYADGLPDNQAKWLKDVGSKFKGAKIRYSGDRRAVGGAQPDQKEFTDPTGIEVEVEIVPRQVLAKATQDVQGQLGSYDLY